MSEPIPDLKHNTAYEALQEQLDLAHLSWATVDPGSDLTPPIPCTIRETAQQSIQLADHVVTLTADHMQSDTDIRELYIFTIIDQGQRVLQISLLINHSIHGITVSTNIGKIPNSRLPGMPLYHHVLNYIQTLSTQRNETMTHAVKRSAGDTRLGRQVLAADDWSAKFTPVLEDRGYHLITDYIWEKKYLPTNSTESSSVKQ